MDALIVVGIVPVAVVVSGAFPLIISGLPLVGEWLAGGGVPTLNDPNDSFENWR